LRQLCYSGLEFHHNDRRAHGNDLTLDRIYAGTLENLGTVDDVVHHPPEQRW
jgi:hypothetical protein